MATATVDTRSFLSQTKFYEGYSRYIEDQERYESWDEAVNRVIDMHAENYINKSNEDRIHIIVHGKPNPEYKELVEKSYEAYGN